MDGGQGKEGHVGATGINSVITSFIDNVGVLLIWPELLKWQNAPTSKLVVYTIDGLFG